MPEPVPVVIPSLLSLMRMGRTAVRPAEGHERRVYEPGAPGALWALRPYDVPAGNVSAVSALPTMYM